MFFIQIQQRKVYLEEKLPIYLGNLESILKKNDGGNGYFVGDGVGIWCLISSFSEPSFNTKYLLFM